MLLKCLELCLLWNHVKKKIENKIKDLNYERQIKINECDVSLESSLR